MANITEELQKIKHAIFGKDVRGAIHDAIKKTYDDAAQEGNANMEVSLARGFFNNLTDRLNSSDRSLAQKTDVAYVDSLISNVTDGGPRELFYSLGALLDMYPNGTSGTMLVFDSSHENTAHSYIWDGTQWKDLGPYQGEGIKDHSVTYPKLAEDVRQKIEGFLETDSIPGTTQDVTIADGNVVRIRHLSKEGQVMREDTFNYSNSLIAETRRMFNGEMLIFHYRLNDASTQILSRERKLYQNEVEYTRETWQEWNGKGAATIDSGFLKIENSATTINLSVPTKVKPKTKYGILFSVRENTRESNAIPVAGSGGAYPFPTPVSVSAGLSGYFKSVQTTNDFTTGSDFRSAITADVGKFVFGDLRIIELPSGSKVEQDFNTLSASLLNRMYPWEVL